GDDTFAPGLWSRYDWTHVGDDLWYCQTTYDAATLADALAAPPADPADPTDGGCSGFAWSRLRPAALAIAGDPTDASEVHHVIDGTRWEQGAASFHVTRFSNAERWVIAQNDAGNPSHP